MEKRYRNIRKKQNGIAWEVITNGRREKVRVRESQYQLGEFYGQTIRNCNGSSRSVDGAKGWLIQRHIHAG